MKKNIFLSLTMLGAFTLGGCSLSGGISNNSVDPSVSQNPTQVPTQVPAQTPASGTPITASAVSIQNFAFNPSSLPVKKGATVTWTNNDSAPHGIKSATFNSSLLSQGQTFSFTFNDVGTFDYSCSVHPSMVGKIIVSN